MESLRAIVAEKWKLLMGAGGLAYLLYSAS